MSNRDHLVDGLHSILEELWEGSDQIAASEFRTLGLACESSKALRSNVHGRDVPGARFPGCSGSQFSGVRSGRYAQYRGGIERWRLKHYRATC